MSTKMPTMKSWQAMLSDEALVDEIIPIHPDDKPSLWWNVTHWMRYYWPPTRGWTAQLDLWWHYNVRRYPRPPRLSDDPVFRRLFGEIDNALEDPQKKIVHNGRPGPIPGKTERQSPS